MSSEVLAATERKMARAVEVMESRPSVGLVYGRPQFFEPDEPLPPVADQEAELLGGADLHRGRVV